MAIGMLRTMRVRCQSPRCAMMILLAAISLKLAFCAESEEEEAPVSQAGALMAATLISCISFIMCLYYFLQYPDPDIRQKSWETVSSTISIFCAVLLFQSFNDLAEAFIIEPLFGESETSDGALLVDMLHMLMWFALMQVILAATSGAVEFKLFGRVLFEKVDIEMYEALDDEEPQKLIKEEKETNMACFAVLTAHISGFASINAFGTVQMKFFNSNALCALGVFPVAFFSQIILQRVTDAIRERVAMDGDGIKDEFEELWDDETEDAENDVMGLTLSFLTVNVVRFAVTGCLPNQEGVEEECGPNMPENYLYEHSFHEKAGLFFAGIMFTVLIFVVKAKFPEWLEKDRIEEKWGDKWVFIGRIAEGMVVGVSMCFAWAFFYVGQMIIAGLPIMYARRELLAVVSALVLSVICLLLLIPLDDFADLDNTGAWLGGMDEKKVDDAIRSVMFALALLIGFAWEQCFDMSVDILAHYSGYKHSMKFFLTVFCAGLLVPAWRLYMLPFIVAKGWRYTWSYKIHDLEPLMHNLVCPSDEEDDEEDHLEGGRHTMSLNREKKGHEKKANVEKLNKVSMMMKSFEEHHGQFFEKDEKGMYWRRDREGRLSRQGTSHSAASLKRQRTIDSRRASHAGEYVPPGPEDSCEIKSVASQRSENLRLRALSQWSRALSSVSVAGVSSQKSSRSSDQPEKAQRAQSRVSFSGTPRDDEDTSSLKDENARLKEELDNCKKEAYMTQERLEGLLRTMKQVDATVATIEQRSLRAQRDQASSMNGSEMSGAGAGGAGATYSAGGMVGAAVLPGASLGNVAITTPGISAAGVPVVMESGLLNVNSASTVSSLESSLLTTETVMRGPISQIPTAETVVGGAGGLQRYAAYSTLPQPPVDSAPRQQELPAARTGTIGDTVTSQTSTLPTFSDQRLP